MRWFSHRRRTGGWHNSRPRRPLPKKMAHVFVFCPWWPKFELGWDFCTVHLTAKFHHPTFNCSEVIMLTNKQTGKQTPLKTSTSLRYATPVGKNFGSHTLACVWDADQQCRRTLTSRLIEDRNSWHAADWAEHCRHRRQRGQSCCRRAFTQTLHTSAVQ